MHFACVTHTETQCHRQGGFTHECELLRKPACKLLPGCFRQKHQGGETTLDLSPPPLPPLPPRAGYSTHSSPLHIRLHEDTALTQQSKPARQAPKSKMSTGQTAGSSGPHGTKAGPLPAHGVKTGPNGPAHADPSTVAKRWANHKINV